MQSASFAIELCNELSQGRTGRQGGKGPRRVPTQAPQRRTPSIKCGLTCTRAFLYIIVIDSELLRPRTFSYHPRCRAPRIAHSKVLTSGQRRSPRRRSQDVVAVTVGLACLGATSCALIRPSEAKSGSAFRASHVLGSIGCRDGGVGASRDRDLGPSAGRRSREA